jgi:hypothetical protein
MHLAWYYWVLVFFGAMVFALICAAIANSQEYMGWGFGIVGFFSFIIIFIIAYNVVLALPAK